MLERLVNPDIDQHLLHEEGEVVLDEVAKHWAASIGWYLLTALSIPLFVLMIPAKGLFWLPLLAGLVVLLFGLGKVHEQHMDRFVITNIRVFRVHGVFTQHVAIMPMSRILDISLTRTILGQLLGYGHFVFESAAQGQGLREIRFVGSPDKRCQMIQVVIQRLGLRKAMPTSKGKPTTSAETA